MSVNDDDQDDAVSVGNPVPERSGATVDEAVATAEEGSQVEGVHTPSGQEASGDSRAEHMTDEPVTEPWVEEAP